MSLFVRSFAITLLVTAGAFAQSMPATTTDESPETKAVRAAAKDFAKALDKETLDDARKLFVGTKENLKIVEQMHDAIKAAKELRDASLKQFPDLEKERRMSDDLTANGLARQYDRAPLTIDGDNATFAGQGTKLQKVNGAWKMVDLFGDPRARQMMSTMIPALAQAMRETTPEIAQGKYPTFKEAEAALQVRMREATMKLMQEMMKNQEGPKSGRETHPDK